MSKRDPDELLEQLRDTGEALPTELREAILEAGSEDECREAVIDGLVEIMQNASLQTHDKTEATACSNAAMLLGLLEAEEEVEALLDEVVRQDQTAFLATTAAQALSGMAEVALPRMVERYEAADFETTRRRLAHAVTGLIPNGDERGLELLVDELMEEKEPIEGQSLLLDIAEYAHHLDVDPEDYAPRLHKWFRLYGRRSSDPSRLKETHEKAIEALKETP